LHEIKTQLPQTVQIKNGIIDAPGWRPPRLHALPAAVLPPGVQASVLRLDEIHATISGNKWFKLRFHIEAALARGCTQLVTFGGNWSNHLVATACICRLYGLPCTGMVRGEAVETATLQAAAGYGMQLRFVSRANYRLYQQQPGSLRGFENACIVPEGGATPLGAKGAAAIATFYDAAAFNHLVCAVGTGTMLAGLLPAAPPAQKITGINVLKGGPFQQTAIAQLAPGFEDRYTLLNEFHWGGYARHSPALFTFMNHWFTATGIPSDFVYTGKLFYAFDRLLQQGYFKTGSRVLLIHSGGLQGNASLPKGTLIF
jgi:1-aminocyclopropane-1-carboxylate deaminase